MKIKIKILLFTFSSMIVAVNKVNDIGVIVVDVQGCFAQATNGSLAVAGTQSDYISKVDFATKALKASGLPIYATQDWHPQNHISFAKNHNKEPFTLIQVDINGTPHDQMLWPNHCEQNSQSAQLLIDPAIFKNIIKKGTDPKYDSYSGFEDDNGKKTELEALLKKDGIKKLIVYGIATDYCVKATAIDGKNAGFDVVFVQSLSRGVAPDTIQAALTEMQQQGIKVVDTINYKNIPALFNT